MAVVDSVVDSAVTVEDAVGAVEAVEEVVAGADLPGLAGTLVLLLSSVEAKSLSKGLPTARVLVSSFYFGIITRYRHSKLLSPLVETLFIAFASWNSSVPLFFQRLETPTMPSSFYYFKKVPAN